MNLCSVDGEYLPGLPPRQLKIIVGWLALHEEEVYAAWNLAVQGEHFDKIEGSAFALLRDKEVLASRKVEHGFVSWANGEADVAPEYMYERGIPYNRQPDWLLAC